mgnify:CR=1 FL=1
MKRMICIALLILMALGLAACQKTPESPIVAGKNNEQMIEKARETAPNTNSALSLQEKTQAPPSLAYDITNNNMTISVNAPVDVPTGSEMNIVRVKAGDFSQDQVTVLWNELVGGTEMFYTSSEMTKSEIEAAIITAKGFVAKAENDDDRARYQAQLDYFNSIYDSAPESREMEKVDGTLKELSFSEYGSDNKTRYWGVAASSEDNSVQFFVNNSYEDAEGSHPATLSFHRSSNQAEIDGQPSVDKYAVDVTDNAVPADATGLTLSPNAASRQIEAFLQKTNMPFSISSISLNNDAGQWYYSAFCTRMVGDIPSAFILGESYNKDESTGYAEAWQYETVSISVDDSGVRSVDWYAPIAIVESVVENSSLMTYSDIQDIFDKMMFIIYEFQAQGAKSLRLDISGVKLETMRIVEQDAGKSGLLVPVWNFYGTRTLEYNDGADNTTSNIILLCINAIDGSIIDIQKGY